MVYLNSKVITARDQAHMELKKLYYSNMPIEEDLSGCAIFHAGPIVSIENDNTYKIKAIGPTTSIRMEPYSELMGKLGVKALIGKGGMGNSATKAMKKYNMVYLLATHGCAAIHTSKFSNVIKQYWLERFGMPEAMWVLKCEEFGPLIVGIDSKGRNLFEETKTNAKAMVQLKYPYINDFTA